LINLNSF